MAYDEQNHLKITAYGRRVLFGHERIQLAVVRRDEAAPRAARGRTKPAPAAPSLPLGGVPALSAGDDALFERLRALRRRLADSEGLPPYIVMSDKVLRALAAIRPTTLEKMSMVNGIGEYKLRKYGALFIDAIKEFAS